MTDREIPHNKCIEVDNMCDDCRRYWAKEWAGELLIEAMISIKDDKIRYDLIPWEAEKEKVRAFMFGAEKYEPWDWLNKNPYTYSKVYAKLRRHIEAPRGGEMIDPESGLLHFAHAACCIDILLTYELRGMGEELNDFEVGNAL